MRKIFNILILLMLAALPAFAGPPDFNAMYWVTGEVTVNVDSGHLPSVNLTDRRVIFYRVLPGGFVEVRATLEAGATQLEGPGQYAINIYDERSLPIISDPNIHYKVAIAKDPTDSYGADPVDVVVTGQGYEIKPLQLGYNLGPPMPLDGAVPLTISFNGANDVKISWDNNTYPNPNIYVFYLNNSTGDGTGQYNNSNNLWFDIGDQGTDAALRSQFNFDNKQNGSILHRDQVGSVSTRPEVYYKAIKSNLTNYSEINGKNILESAWAVGKLDIPLYVGFNLVSLPFNPPGIGSIDDTFSSGIRTENNEIYVRDDSSGSYTKVYYSGGWQALTVPITSLPLSSAFWARNQSADTIKTTVAGNVLTTGFTRTVYGAGDHPSLGGYNLVGWPIPAVKDLTAGKLPVRGDDEVYLRFNEDGHYEKDYNSGGVWTNLTPGQLPFNMIAGRGYWYRNMTTDFNWTSPTP